MYQLLTSYRNQTIDADLFDSYPCLLNAVSPLIGETRADIENWDENTRELPNGISMEWLTYYGDVGIDAPDYCASCGDRLDTWNMTEEEKDEVKADTAPDVYTHTRWLEFTDLAAYQEVSETGAWPDDLTEAAGVALYQIAYRLISALMDEYFEGDE